MCSSGTPTKTNQWNKYYSPLTQNEQIITCMQVENKLNTQTKVHCEKAINIIRLHLENGSDQPTVMLYSYHTSLVDRAMKCLATADFCNGKENNFQITVLHTYL